MYENNYSNYGDNRGDKGIVNAPLTYGCDTYEMVNPKYAKIVFRVNSSGNLTIECTPSFTPGKLPEGVSNGVIPAGQKIFNYDNKIIYSITFDDCVNITDMVSDFKYENKTPAPIHIYRKSTKFNKKLSISYVQDRNNDYYVIMNFESTDSNNNTIKFDLPLNVSKFELFARVMESYINSYHMIKYYNQVETAKDDKLNVIIAQLSK